MGHVDLIRELTGKCNAGDLDGVCELYGEDAEIRTGPHWPADWASLWERIQIEVDDLDKVLATGASQMRGAASAHRRGDTGLHRVHVPGWEDRGP